MTTFRVSPVNNFDYVEASDPAVSTNPAYLYASWLNETTGQIFICTNNAPGANVWVGQMGDTIE